MEEENVKKMYVWYRSYLAVISLSSKLFSNCDFIYFTEGSLDSWGGAGRGFLNRYQRGKSRTVFALEKCTQHPTKGVQHASKIRDWINYATPNCSTCGAFTESLGKINLPAVILWYLKRPEFGFFFVTWGKGKIEDKDWEKEDKQDLKKEINAVLILKWITS